MQTIRDPWLEDHLREFARELGQFRTATGSAYATSLGKLNGLSRDILLKLTPILDANADQRRNAFNLLQEATDSFRESEIDSGDHVAHWQENIQGRFNDLVASLEEGYSRRAKKLGGRGR